MPHFAVLLQSASSEILPAELPKQIVNKMKLFKAFVRKMCAASYTFGIKACAEIESRNAASLRRSPIYAAVGKHSVYVKVSPGK